MNPSKIYDKEAESYVRANKSSSKWLMDMFLAVGKIPNLRNITGPAEVEHVAKGLLGGTGRNILFMADVMDGNIQGRQAAPQHLPIIRRLYAVAEDWKYNWSSINAHQGPPRLKALELSFTSFTFSPFW